MDKRKHLKPTEVEKLIKACLQTGRHGERDALLVRLAYNHGLRANELVSLLWSDIDLEAGIIMIRRLKHSDSGEHPLFDDEKKALRQLAAKRKSKHVFVSEQGNALHHSVFRKLIKRAAEVAGIEIAEPDDWKRGQSKGAHPHMLRHGCGYKLINQGIDVRVVQDFLGHRNIQHTVLYTKLDSNRFNAIKKLA